MNIDERRLSGAIRETAPCTGCTERFRACWDHCPKDERGEFGYMAWKTEIKRVKHARIEYAKRNAKKYAYYGREGE